MWHFIQNQILGMKWLYTLVENLINALGLDITTKVGGTMLRDMSRQLVKNYPNI